MGIKLYPTIEDIKDLDRTDGRIVGKYDGKKLVLFLEGEGGFYDGFTLSPRNATELYQKINDLINLRNKEEGEGIFNTEHEGNQVDPLPKAEVIRRPGFFEGLFGRKK